MTSEVANETIQKLGLAIGQDVAVSSTEWTQLWMVFKIEGSDIEEFGSLEIDSQEIGFLVEGDEPGDLALRLRDVMYTEDGNSWVACKVTLIRETRDINIKFEYEDPHIWDTPLPF